MIKFICCLCGKEVDHATFIGNPTITNGGFYICDECKNNNFNPVITFSNGRDADADMYCVPQTFDDNDCV